MTKTYEVIRTDITHTVAFIEANNEGEAYTKANSLGAGEWEYTDDVNIPSYQVMGALA